MQPQIDDLRRDLAAAVWKARNRKERLTALAPYAKEIFTLYTTLHPAHPEPKPVGLQLAGRMADGSYIFSGDGRVKHFTRVDGEEVKRVKRRVSRRTFPAHSYYKDVEFSGLYEMDKQ